MHIHTFISTSSSSSSDGLYIGGKVAEGFQRNLLSLRIQSGFPGVVPPAPASVYYCTVVTICPVEERVGPRGLPGNAGNYWLGDSAGRSRMGIDVLCHPAGWDRLKQVCAISVSHVC